MFYNDSNKICKDTVKYYVTIGDAIGCQSNSTVASDLFIDNTVPLAPELKCVAVASNGDVTITWVPPIDTGLLYDSYHIYHSNSVAGPFTQIGTIFNYSQTSFTHVGVNANINTPYYYVQTLTGCGVQFSDPSDTLRSIKLNVNNTGTGVAYLQWNAVHTPLLSTSSSYYRIYREYPVNSWTIIDSTTALDYLDTINLCNAFINYRIEIEDFSGCISVSNVDGDLFQDVTPPALTVLDTISVDPATGQVHLSWELNTSDDTQGYIIYLYNGASWDSIGAVSGIGTLSWIHILSNANNGSQIYSIAAYDSCGNLSPIGVQHNTIFVTDTLNKCEGTITLNWNQYINMPNGVASYNVYYNVNNGTYSLLGTVSNSTYSYVHTPIKKDTLYCYVITAIGNDIWRTSTSNRTCQLADALVFPKYTYLKTASVTASNEISISAYVDPTNDVSKYKLMRSLNPNSDYTPIQFLPNTGLTTIDFIDEDVETNAYSYYYRVIPVSTCETDMDTSNLGRTILLRVKANENLTNTLSWTPYEDWSGKVRQYKIFRQMDGVWSTTPIAILPDDKQAYLDDIANYYRGTGEFCYYIEANEDIGNIDGFIETSLSNEACDAQIPHLYIPNAFTPGGSNPIFKPEGAFIDSANYYFAVFNRWGQPIYETTNFTEGWDGTYENADAPQGVYAYVAKMVGTNGTALVRRGNVNLLR
ncbi:MAG: gliding motility-associated C-terminal domain-containing protein [Bacteroidetes bacterium]|nr:gliding motility-associated C-terminal domain-containing protein [Bacteroidota bacterium]